ncbi:MAG: hypothetical protein ACP5KN_11640, partial [Armatimonadota bacterium]
DGDGAVALADYSPNLPFSEIDAERWTQAGEAIRECVRRSQAAVSTQWLPSDPDDLVRRALAEMQDTTIAELRDYLADGLTVLSEQVDVEVEYADWDSDAGEWVNQGLEQVPLNLRELWDSPPGSFRALAPPYLYIFPNWAEYTLSDSTELLFRAHSMDGEDYSCSLWPLTTTAEEDLFPIAIKAGQHRAQFDSDEGPVDLTFTSDWREVSGTIGGTSVTGTLDEEGWVDWTFAIRWDEIPDRTISGMFPDPEQIRDLAMADYDRYVYRYGHFEVRDEPWWVE